MGGGDDQSVKVWTPAEQKRTTFSREVVLDVEPHESKAYVTPDGREFQDARITLTAEAAERMWQGYMCARCLEPFIEAYPKLCVTCGFPVKELQRKLLERDFIGRDPTAVAGFPMERELAYLEEKHHKPKPRMTVPKEIK
jgi:ribosomal protein L34E